MTPESNGLQRTRTIVTVAAIVIAWVGSLATAAWSAAGDRAAVLQQLNAQTATNGDVEARLRELERATSQVATDVRWIRQSITADLRP